MVPDEREQGQHSEGDPRRLASVAGELDEGDRTFVHVRDLLYGGSWQELECDLQDRLAGKPFVFKLATRIEEDLARIERLRALEQQHGVNLADVLSTHEGTDEVDT